MNVGACRLEIRAVECVVRFEVETLFQQQHSIFYEIAAFLVLAFINEDHVMVEMHGDDMLLEVTGAVARE